MSEIRIKAELNNMPVVTEYFEEQAEALGVPLKIIMRMNVVLDEILGNIINYAYPDKEGDVLFCMDMEDNNLKLRFEDSGIPYDPLAKEDPDITLSAEEREIGGLGILISKKMTDKIVYAYEDGKNKLTIWKKIN